MVGATVLILVLVWLASLLFNCGTGGCDEPVSYKVHNLAGPAWDDEGLNPRARAELDEIVAAQFSRSKDVNAR